MDHGNAFERVILALERHDQVIRRREGVERENPQRRRTIDHNQLMPLARAQRFERLTQAVQMVFQSRHFNLGAAHIDFARDDLEPFVSRALDFFFQRAFAEQGAIGARALRFFNAESAGGVGLRVEIDKQDASANRGQASRQADRRRGLAHAAFLIGNRDDFGRHAVIK